MYQHEQTWLRAKDLLKEACFSLEEFDNMTNKRIERILDAQEERLKLQHEQMERERKDQDRNLKKMTK